MGGLFRRKIHETGYVAVIEGLAITPWSWIDLGQQHETRLRQRRCSIQLQDGLVE